MTIISLKPGVDKDTLRIELSDGSLFSFRTCYLPPILSDKNLNDPFLFNGSELNAEEEQGFRFASECLRTEKISLRLIARAEQTFFGLSRKLEKRGHEPACIRAVVSRLAELELLDDRRYVRLWLASRLSRRADSPRRLLSSLCARGIERDDAESGLKAALDTETEMELLLRYVNKLKKHKSSGKSADKPKPGLSLKYILKGEGFSPGVIQEFFEDDHAEDNGYTEFLP